MNVLYANWQCFGADDIIEAFQNLGHEVNWIELTETSHERVDWSLVEFLETKIKEVGIELIVSFNYFPTLSEACRNTNCKYMAIVYDSPSIKVYSPSIINECNYVFVFDKAISDDLNKKGVQTVFYAPLAVNVERLSKIKVTDEELRHYGCDIGFIGSLYNEKHNLYDRLTERTKDRQLIGYLEGIMEAQLKVYGYNFLKECLKPDIIKAMYEAMPFEVEEGSLTDKEYVYSDYFLCRKLANIERTRNLSLLSRYFNVHLYTNNQDVSIGNCINMGKMNYYTEMPKTFQASKINLNMTVRSIRTGIPLRAMDIMGTGGFLLTNFQEDFLLHFEPDKDFVYYASQEELLEKSEYYLKHETERKRIASNGRKRIKEDHTYEKRLKALLEIITR